MDYRSETERNLHEWILQLMNTLGSGSISRVQFREAMGYLRDMKVKLDNMERGCPTGRHSSICACDLGITRSIRHIKKEVA